MDNACHPHFRLLRRNGIFLHTKVLHRSLDKSVDKACHPHFRLLRRNGIFFPTKVLRRSLDGLRKYRSLDDSLTVRKTYAPKQKVSASHVGQPSTVTCVVL